MDIWEGTKKFLKTAVPIAANAFIPGSGGLVSSLISSVFGVDGDDPEAVEAALKNADPDKLIAFKEKVMAHETELLQIAAKREMTEMELRYQDIGDARKRETMLTQLTGKRDINLFVLAWVVCSGFFVLVGLLTFKKLPDTNTQAPFLLFGALASGFGQVLQYFFGSSKSSTDKTAIIARKIQ